MATQSPETANESKREKKRGGFFARLFGGGSAGSGGTFGAGGFGGFGGAGGNFGGGLLGRLLGSGILATKAGLLALILVGATVAGGLGLIGYNMMSGPAQPGDSVQLFASKPKNNSTELPPVPDDGTSASLKFFAQANSDPGTPEAAQAASAEAPKDQTAAGAAASNAASEVGPSNVAAATGNGVSTLLKNGKFGQLTSPGSMGKGAVTAAGAKPVPGADAGTAATAAHLGTLSAMKKGPASANGARSLAGRRFGNHGALGQAFGAMRDNRSATSSAGGGLTYDGAANAGSNIGANGSAIGGASGDGTGPAQAKNVTNPAAVDPSLSPPPTPTAVDQAPWQNAIKTAQMLIGLAVALMLVAKLAAKTQYGKIIAMIIAAVVAGIGGMVIALGAQIANGQYGQKLQGGVLAAAGVGLMIAAAAIAFGGDSSKTNSTGLNTAGTADTAAADTTGGASSAGGAGDSGSMLSSINPFVLIGGGIGLIGLAGTMMIPPKKYPSKDFPNGNPPDTHFFGTQRMPSEEALKKMVA